MKLNHDCVRDLLLTIEEKVKSQPVYIGLLANNTLLHVYEITDLIYTSERLSEAGLINIKIFQTLDGEKNILVKSITWNGHQFLDNIRDNNVWSKTKKTVSALSSVSLSILVDIAKKIVEKSIGI